MYLPTTAAKYYHGLTLHGKFSVSKLSRHAAIIAIVYNYKVAYVSYNILHCSRHGLIDQFNPPSIT